MHTPALEVRHFLSLKKIFYRCTLFCRCDNEADCVNRTDEIGCPHHPCNTTEFTCANGQCIPERFKCDRENDCIDGSDERNCVNKEPTNCTGTKIRTTISDLLNAYQF